MSEYAIDVRDLVKKYDNRVVVDRLTLQIKPGRICGFLGPNGSGKTTSLRMICGLLNPDSGEGTCLNYDVIRQRDYLKKEVGYMTQKFGLYDDLTIRENLEFMGRMHDLSPLNEYVDKAIDDLGLRLRQHQLTGCLSGGWKQRLALAACVMHRPKILLLDEPTAGVDPKARRDFWDQIRLFAAQGITILVSTHYMEEAERCDEIAFIAYGVLMARGLTMDIIREANLFAYTAIGEDMIMLIEKLKDISMLSVVSSSRTSIRVCSRDLDLIEKSIAPYRNIPDVTWVRGEPNLEEVFIDLMVRSKDNMTMNNMEESI